MSIPFASVAHPQSPLRQRINSDADYIPRPSMSTPAFNSPIGGFDPPPIPFPSPPPQTPGNPFVPPFVPPTPPEPAPPGAHPSTSTSNHQSPPTSSSSFALWGNPDIKTFMNCIDNVEILNGLNWTQFKLKFQILAQAFGLGGFLQPPPNGHAPPNDSALAHEYRRYSSATYTGIYMRSSSSIQFEIRQYLHTSCPAIAAWHHLGAKYEAVDVRLQFQLQEQLANLHLIPGKADRFITTARELRDRLMASQCQITTIQFNGYLLKGLPDSWDSFKTNVRLSIHLMTEDHL